MRNERIVVISNPLVIYGSAGPNNKWSIRIWCAFSCVSDVSLYHHNNKVSRHWNLFWWSCSKIFWCRDFVIFPSSCNALLLITHNALLLLSIAWLLLYTHNAFVICTWSRIIILKKTSYTARKVTKNKNSIFSCFIIYL